MMLPLIPIFMCVLNMVAARTVPIDYVGSRIGNGVEENRRNDMFLPSASLNVGLNEFAKLKAAAERQHRMNFVNDADPRILKEQRTRLQNDRMYPRKMDAHDDDIDDEALEELEAASISIDEMDENDLNHLSQFLTNVLQQPTYEPPLVVVEEPIFSQELEDADSGPTDEIETGRNVWKRSRYYRQYPWKRNRSRNGYDYEAAHLCNPTRDDIVKLLVALHDVRQGNKSRSVHFCKRRRSAGTLFTNIRFLGRRK